MKHEIPAPPKSNIFVTIVYFSVFLSIKYICEKNITAYQILNNFFFHEMKILLITNK